MSNFSGAHQILIHPLLQDELQDRSRIGASHIFHMQYDVAKK